MAVHCDCPRSGAAHMAPRPRAASSLPRRRLRLERLEDRAVPAIAFAVGAGGRPQVNVYDETGALVRSFLAYGANFRGGVSVAVRFGNIEDQVLTGAGPGTVAGG